MTKYLIKSDKVGNVGDEFLPEEGINVNALLEGGFIEIASKKTPAKADDDSKE